MGISREEFHERLRSDVQVRALDEAVILTRNGTEGVEGIFGYTVGLQDLIGFELVAFGAFDIEDIQSSALLIHSNFPRGVAIPIPMEIIRDLNADVPEADYRQYVVDESALEDENETVSEQPQWVAEGGFPILDDGELQAKLKEGLEAFDQARHAGMEFVRDGFRQKIRDYGHAIVGVFDPENAGNNYAYTVGLTKQKLPEFVITGAFSIEDLSRVLNHFAHQARDEGHALRTQVDGLTLSDDVKLDLRVVDVDPVYAVDRMLVQAPLILKEPVTRVAWVQFSDPQKRFPGDEGYENYVRQGEVSPVIAKGGSDSGVLKA